MDDGQSKRQYIEFEADSGGGKVSIAANGNLTRWIKPLQADLNWSSRPLTWNPLVCGKVNLGNIGADSLAQLIPDPKIVPASGYISGEVEFCVKGSGLEIESDSLKMANVIFSDNETGERYVSAETAGCSFEGDLENVDFLPFSTCIAIMTEEGVRNESAEVRARAARKTAELQKGLSQKSVEQLNNSRSDDVKKLLGAVLGTMLMKKLLPEITAQDAVVLGTLAAGAVSSVKKKIDESSAKKKNNSKNSGQVSQSSKQSQPTGGGNVATRAKAKVASSFKRAVSWLNRKSQGQNNSPIEDDQQKKNR